MLEPVKARVERARRRRFERLVARALDELPPAVVAMLDNVAVVIDDEPSPAQCASFADGEAMFGLYEGAPRSGRDSGYGLVLPDKITIFRGPLERAFRAPTAITREVRVTVLHELGHHLGFDEDGLEALGLG